MNKLYRRSYKQSKSRKRNRVSRSQNNELSESKDTTADHIMHLQRTVGNQAVQRLIKNVEIQGKRPLGHELAHVVQQENKGRIIQRCEAEEHAILGDDRRELKAAFTPIRYTVWKGDTLHSIAEKFEITVADLKATNKSKLRQWPATNSSRRMIEGFNVWETIIIPKKPKDSDLLAPRYKVRFTLNGLVLDYGVGIAMGDFFESPEQMAGASWGELEELVALIKREQSGGGLVSTEEWQKASRGRYLKLAEKNEAHFAPPDAELVEMSTAGAASTNHKSEWEKHHMGAIKISIDGDKDKALMTNAFADHFLTDAFSVGHLVNKRDVMEKFTSQLVLGPSSNEFTDASKKFFDAIARDAFTGSVKTEFSKYKLYTMGWSSSIDTVGAFSTLLQGIYKEDPDLLANAVAKGVHDKLDTIPDGISVENERGHKWRLSGDSALNATITEIAKWAVARSQRNIISSYKHPDWIDHPDLIDYPDMYKSVWDYTPKPDTAGTGQLVGVVKKGTDVNGEELKKEVVEFIEDNYKLLIDDLVKRKVLKKA